MKPIKTEMYSHESSLHLQIRNSLHAEVNKNIMVLVVSKINKKVSYWGHIWHQVDVNINNIYDEVLERVNNNV